MAYVNRGPQVVSSYTPQYTTSGTTQFASGSAYAASGMTQYATGAPQYTTASATPYTNGRVIAAPATISGNGSFATSYSARPGTMAAAAPTYTTVPSKTMLSQPATTFNTGAQVINGSARVIQSSPTYAQQYITNATPTVTAAPVTYISEAIAAPAIIETIAPGQQFVEVAAPGFVETIVAPAVVETIAVSPGEAEPLPEAPLTLTYWPLFGKGAASVIALQVGGFNWQLGAAPGSKGTGDLWGEWLDMKPDTPWGFLPTLDIGGDYQVGSELAILQFLARKAGAPLQGANDFEFRVSQELLHQSEELYQKLVQKCPTIMAPDKSAEDFEALWTGADRNTHSSQQGIPVYLTQFEEFYGKVGGRDGVFTSSGVTIGEIKLYATLACLLLIDNGILSQYPGLLEFYMRWESDPRVKCQDTTILDVALQEWGWQQFFIAPLAPAAQDAPVESNAD